MLQVGPSRRRCARQLGTLADASLLLLESHECGCMLLLLPGQLLWRLIVFGVDVALGRSEQIVVDVVVPAHHDVKDGGIQLNLVGLDSVA